MGGGCPDPARAPSPWLVLGEGTGPCDRAVRTGLPSLSLSLMEGFCIPHVGRLVSCIHPTECRHSSVPKPKSWPLGGLGWGRESCWLPVLLQLSRG